MTNAVTSEVWDYLIVGAGMAGASAAFELAGADSVVILEAEAQPGYHTTGRSAAFYTQTYGNETIGALTTGSLTFFEQPPAGFTAHPLLSPRGSLFIGRADQQEAVRAYYESSASRVAGLSLEDGAFARKLVPVLREEAVASCVWEPEAQRIDVHAMLQGYLRGCKARGGRLVTNARVESAQRESGLWTLQTTAGNFRGRIVVNAAGAWGDELAALAGAAPVGLTPMRRTACIVEISGDLDCEPWPAVADVEEAFYFIPDAGHLLLSPADETPVAPSDAYPEDLDVAVAVDRLEKATTLNVRRVIQQWAGLRTFAPDRAPVVGFDPKIEGFFWLAGQGGYGIQTAPALARLAAGLITGRGVPRDLGDSGLAASALRPGRSME